MAASGDDWQVPYLAQLLDDPYAAVRFAAGRSLTHQPSFERFPFDFRAPSIQRGKAVRLAVTRWEKLPVNRKDRPRVLLQNQTLDWETVRTMLALRDDRPIQVAE